MSGYIYLLKINNEQINDLYKIGRTENMNKRIKQYPKCTEQIMVKLIDNYVNIEQILIGLFKSTFKLYKGNEYFIGNVDKMKNFINYACDEYFINDTVYVKFISDKSKNTTKYVDEFNNKKSFVENIKKEENISEKKSSDFSNKSTKKDLQNHNDKYKESHVEKTNIFHCFICDQDFTTKKRWQQHINKDNCFDKPIKKNYLFYCCYCDNEYKHQSSCSKHIKKCKLNTQENVLNKKEKRKMENTLKYSSVNLKLNPELQEVFIKKFEQVDRKINTLENKI